MLGRWIDGRSVPFRGPGGGKDPRRTNLKRHQLHDGVQLAGGILPDHVLDSRAPRRRAPQRPVATPTRARPVSSTGLAGLELR